MQRTIIILGMHRSGTSCLTGILEKAGVYFGEVSNFNSYNIKGNKENKRIMKLHNHLLHHNHGSWDNPPEKVSWPFSLKKERDAIIREHSHIPVWGFKDPRALFALEGWIGAMPNISFVSTYRHPMAVAQSLLKRNGFPLDKSFLLWKAYNKSLLNYIDKYHFPVISFDLPSDEYREKAMKLLQILGFEVNINCCDFFDNTLRNHIRLSDTGVPEEILQIYEQLCRFSL